MKAIKNSMFSGWKQNWWWLKKGFDPQTFGDWKWVSITIWKILIVWLQPKFFGHQQLNLERRHIIVFWKVFGYHVLGNWLKVFNCWLSGDQNCVVTIKSHYSCHNVYSNHNYFIFGCPWSWPKTQYGLWPKLTSSLSKLT